MSLNPGPLTFSADRLRKVWRDYQPAPRPFRYDYYQSFQHDSNHNLQEPHIARKFCLKLYQSVQDPMNHLNNLASSFDPINLRPFVKTALSESAVIERACRLLSQLPATAPDILDALPWSTSSLHEYQLQTAEIGMTTVATREDRWKQLRVVHYVDNFILRYALHVAVFQLEAKHRKHQFNGGPVADSILLLLQLSLQLSAEDGRHDAKWLIVCAFLWTSWQRGLMIHLWSCLASQVDGFDHQHSYVTHRKGLNLIPQIAVSRSQQDLEQFRCTPYLCGWAYRSLRNDRANVAMDLRYFHDLYHAYFGERRPICNQGPTQCDGSSSHACRRFKNTGARNQSMHDHECDGSCQRLFWSRESFLSVSGAKAIDITTTDQSDKLQYCKVSDSTLTISHVWSHGQGGRPDKVSSEGTGFNLCLHRRYANLATFLGCGSYWMDTPCIPSEKVLRWECIAQITSIFAISGKTIICDRDIMTIDISRPTIRAYETILATLLVCDWGIRAWTLLEAMRGRYGLFVLCHQNKLINLHQLLISVHENGRMDLVNLFLARDYLFPPLAISDFELFGVPVTTEAEKETEQGFVSIGDAAALLSHRHATRDDDDLLIWSLLIGDIEDNSPIAMWERQVGKRIPTGSLVSSAQRIQDHPGLGWAPYSPTALQKVNENDHGSKVYPAYDGTETFRGLITAEGLRAKWLTYEFLIPAALTPCEEESPNPNLPGPCISIAARHLSGYKWGALLQTMPCQGPRNIPVAYPESLGWVVVVCGSQGKVVWEWKGIYEWNKKTNLPPFSIKEILII